MTSLDFETTFQASRRSRILEGAVAKDPNAVHAKRFSVQPNLRFTLFFFFGTDSHLGLRGGFRTVKIFGWGEQIEPNSCFKTSSLSLCSFFFFLFLSWWFFLFSLDRTRSSAEKHGGPVSNPPGLLFSPLRTFARKSAGPVSDLRSFFLRFSTF